MNRSPIVKLLPIMAAIMEMRQIAVIINPYIKLLRFAFCELPKPYNARAPKPRQVIAIPRRLPKKPKKVPLSAM